MSIEEFIISNFEGLSVSSLLFILILVLLRNGRQDNKEGNDVLKGLVGVMGEAVKGREENTKAVNNNTEAQNAAATANLAAHRQTHENLEKLESTQATMATDLRNLIADFSTLKAAVNSTINDTKSQAANVAQIALRFSNVENSIQRLIDKFYPQPPSSTQEIPVEVQVEARVISALPAPEINPT